jgi:hypothetical protein
MAPSRLSWWVVRIVVGLRLAYVIQATCGTEGINVDPRIPQKCLLFAGFRSLSNVYHDVLRQSHQEELVIVGWFFRLHNIRRHIPKSQNTPQTPSVLLPFVPVS